MKAPGSSTHGKQPIQIPPEVEAKCEGPNQFENFDRLFRSVISVPKAAIDKEEARLRRKKVAKKKQAR